VKRDRRGFAYPPCNGYCAGCVVVERVVVVVSATGGGIAGAVVLSVVVVVVGGLPPQPLSKLMPPNKTALASSRKPDLSYFMSLSFYGLVVVVDWVLVVAGGGAGDCVVVVELLSLLVSPTVP
jgi:hypothetical protein